VEHDIRRASMARSRQMRLPRRYSPAAKCAFSSRLWGSYSPDRVLSIMLRAMEGHEAMRADDSAWCRRTLRDGIQ
jgi:hypothetical protein